MMVRDDTYCPRVLCEALPETSLKILEHVFNDNGIKYEVASNGTDSVNRISEVYFDLIVLNSNGNDLSALLAEKDEVLAYTPTLNITQLNDGAKLLQEIRGLIFSDHDPDWSYFESTFADDPDVVSSLKIELVKELAQFEKGVLNAFERKEIAIIRDAIHRVEVVCGQLNLQAFLRLFYYFRRIDDLDKSLYLKNIASALVASVNSRL